MKYLLDTNILSDMMRQGDGLAARHFMQRINDPESEIFTSVIVQYELMYGLHKGGSARLSAAFEVLMQRLEAKQLDSAVGAAYAQMRYELEKTGKSLGVHDLLIAAQAQTLGATLVSADMAFAFVPNLRLENWLRD